MSQGRGGGGCVKRGLGKTGGEGEEGEREKKRIGEGRGAHLSWMPSMQSSGSFDSVSTKKNRSDVSASIRRAQSDSRRGMRRVRALIARRREWRVDCKYCGSFVCVCAGEVEMTEGSV